MQRVFGDNLRRHRASLGLSQEELAEVLNVSRTYVGGVERGERNLSLRSVEKICSALNVPTMEFLVTPRDVLGHSRSEETPSS